MSHGGHFRGDWRALPPYLMDPYLSGGGSDSNRQQFYVPMADPFWQPMAEPRMMMIRGRRVLHGVPPATSPFSAIGVEVSLLNHALSRELRPYATFTPPQTTVSGSQTPSLSSGSKLTEEEQDRALKKLRREVYTPPLPPLGSRLCLYYRDRYADAGNAKLAEEGGKRCAVCLEDFEAKEEVRLTPCEHMFHEDCIVPWVKTNGNCPVCRCSLYDRRRSDLH
ncbi:E3 ubiquitin-protein ligase Iruka [Linum grandiflorum]